MTDFYYWTAVVAVIVGGVCANLANGFAEKMYRHAINVLLAIAISYLNLLATS